jgi:sugar phosphate isomerase/epimerase
MNHRVPEGVERLVQARGRRQFLKASALGTLAFGFGPAIALAFDNPQKFKIGMAATTWLSAVGTTASYWNATEVIASLGIGATEADNSRGLLDSAYAKKPNEFRERSRKIGVYLTGVYQALPLHDAQKLPEMRSKIHTLAGFLKAARAEYIALGWDVPDVGGKPYQRTAKDVHQSVRAADEIGKTCLNEHGIFAAFHAERDIPKDMVIQILDQTDPKYVRFCADVGHLTAIGLDAVQTVKKYSSRLAISHWKDFDPKLAGPDYLGPEAKGDFTELGKGIVDFPALADLYRAIGFQGWVQLELDQTHEPSILASATEMKAYVTDTLKLHFYAPHHYAA